MMDRRLLLKGALSLAGSYAACNALVPAASALPPGLREVTARQVGAVLDRWQLQDAAWRPLILRNFNLVSQGKLKWSFVRPQQNTWNFEEPDWISNFCTSHKLAMHGHNLCWNANNPAWLASALKTGDPARILTEHITTVVRRYAGRITSWDVVNEPVATWMGRADGLYTGPWLDALGPEYIDLAFHAAAAADPNALRVLNTAHLEQGGRGSDQARASTLKLIDGLLARHVPVQAIGLESHLNGAMASKDIPARARFLKEIRARGLQVLITELDVDDTNLPVSSAEDDRLVAQAYRDYLTSILAEANPAKVIFFCPADERNWYDALQSPATQRQGGASHRPGLCDATLSPKPALKAAADALAGRS